MFQYSIYMRHCASMEQAQTHVRRVKAMLPDEGEVVIMTLTDKQFGMMQHFSSCSTSLRASLPMLFSSQASSICYEVLNRKSSCVKEKPVDIHGLFSF